MCEIINLNGSTVIICGGHKDHQCDEKAVVYETREKGRLYFKNSDEGNAWYKQNYKDIIMGSVACSICGGAVIDEAWKL